MFQSLFRRPALLGLAVLVCIILSSLYFLGFFAGPSPASDDDPFANLSDQEILAAAKRFYDSRPYYERPRDYSKIPAGLTDLRAETCGQCHQQIYQEWSISTHARAWTDDIQFMVELEKNSGEGTQESPDVSWTWVNCHFP